VRDLGQAHVDDEKAVLNAPDGSHSWDVAQRVPISGLLLDHAPSRTWHVRHQADGKRPAPGLYTRYGDVRELVNDTDDRFVIMGSGDELRLQFANRGLPPLAPNWRRDVRLLVDGWAKDSDGATAFSQTVEPLPFHAMSRYPYPASEQYPDDFSHQAYRREYNTRPAIRFVQPARPSSVNFKRWQLRCS